MKKDNIKNIIICLLLVVILILLVFIFVDYKDEYSSNKVDNNSQNIENVEKIEEESSKDNDVNYNQNDFIRQTNITLVEEPKCSGIDGKGSLVANIESNGNISISQNGGAIMVTPGNAKYLYSVTKLACDSVELYYITSNNELYLVSQDKVYLGLDVVATKVTESSVVEFLGTEVKENKSYIKVLLSNGEVEYINYLTTLN